MDRVCYAEGMNPGTKVTLEQIQAICAKYAIPYRTHSRITTGFSHELHRINDDVVIKLFNNHDKDDGRRLNTESALLALALSFPKPKLIAKDDSRRLIDRGFLIMTYVPGFSLGSKWHEATAIQREEVIKTISQALRSINCINPSDLGLSEQHVWQDIVKVRTQAHLADLQDKSIIDTSTVKKIQQTFSKYLPSLGDSPLHPVYWDIHFDNFIVDDNFKLQAVIDLENVELAALDYPLFVIQKMTDEPEKYFSEENEKYADKKDYKNLKGWYQKYYPEMFAFSDSESRLRLYQLLDTLHLLKDWPHVKGLHIKLERLCR